MTQLNELKHSVLEYKNKKGFTLIELIVVMAIIAVLVLLAAPRFLGRTNDAVAAQIQNDIRVAEDKVMELLVTENSRVDEWEVVPSDELTGLMDDNTLYGRGGEFIEIEESDFFRQLDDAFIANDINSNLQGQFFITNEGDVLYLGMGGFGQDGSDIDDTTPEEPEPLTYDEWVEARETEGYVMATDIDFEKDGDGRWRYVGEDNFVIVPNVINGETITSHHSMFMGTAIQGVAASNSAVEDMRRMFQSSSSSTLDLSHLDTSGVNNMSGMFRDSMVSELDLSHFDTSNVEEMSYMFFDSNAISLNLSGFDTSNVTLMDHMFYDANAAPLDLSSFDTSNVTSVWQMFWGSAATTGYARTQTDADLFNNSPNKAAGLTFIVKP